MVLVYALEDALLILRLVEENCSAVCLYISPDMCLRIVVLIHDERAKECESVCEDVVQAWWLLRLQDFD